MIVNTDFMGEVEYSAEEIITIEDGLYGFEDKKKFIVVDPQDEEFPFMWLQSLDDEELSFVITHPFLFCPTYEFELSQKTIDELGIESEENIVIYSIAVIKENVGDSTLNLKSPVIVNSLNKKGKQVILEENYPFKYEMFK